MRLCQARGILFGTFEITAGSPVSSVGWKRSSSIADMPAWFSQARR